MNFTEKAVAKSAITFQKLENRSLLQVILEVGFAFVILVLATLGNFLMMAVMYKKTQLRTIPNLFVVNFSVGNFLLAVAALPVFIWTLIKGKWTFSGTFCEIHGYLNYLLFAVTLFTLTAISLNRYILICYPGIYQDIFNKKLAVKIIAGIWILCVICCTPPLFGWGRFSFNPRTALCHSDNTSSSFKYAANTFMLLDIIIVVFCNIKIAHAVKAHRRRIAVKNTKIKNETRGNDKVISSNEYRTEAMNVLAFPKQQDGQSCLSGNPTGFISARFIYVSKKPEESRIFVAKNEPGTTKKEIKRNKETHFATVCFRKNISKEVQKKQQQTRELRGDEIHITRTISLIVLVFCCCWLPCFIMDSMDASGFYPARNLRMAGIYLIFLDGVVGPFVYGIRNRKLRKAFVDILKCGN